MEHKFYLSAYEGIEAISNFASRGEIKTYTELLMKKSQEQVDFITNDKNVPKPIRLFEVGTGNGRIPISLAKKGVLEYSLGIDVSRSRIAFAKLWAQESNLDNIDFKVWDIFDFPIYKTKFNLCLIITGAFGYFYPSYKAGDKKVLDYIYKSLLEKGAVILELYNHVQIKKLCRASGNSTMRYWDRLPKEDPFSFYPHDVSYDNSKRILTHKKIFIKRNNGSVDDNRIEVLKLYTKKKIENLLKKSGFDTKEIYADWSRKPWYEDRENSIIVAAKK